MDDLPIISTHALHDLVQKKNPRIIDCRFNLSDPDWGFENYLLGHIPGAIYANLNRDLSGTAGLKTGRHPLPDTAAFIQKLAVWGISPETLVVVYDTVGGAFASRLWFMLRAIGHRQVQVLDGGFPKWQADGYPVSIGLESSSPVNISTGYSTFFNQRMVATTPEIEAALNDLSTVFIDARAAERYQGTQEPIDPIAGHIPEALNRFHGNNLTPEGVFKAGGVLREELLALLANHPASQVVVYCGSGVTSCHHLIALELAGLSGARLYAGSWSEWIRDPSRPIALGQK